MWICRGSMDIRGAGWRARWRLVAAILGADFKLALASSVPSTEK
jgi:hypothetical protein